MLFYNLVQLDELPFLKYEKIKCKSKDHFQLLLHQLRNLTYRQANLISKILLCFPQSQCCKPIYKVHLFTERQICSLEQLFAAANKVLPQTQFSNLVADCQQYKRSSILYLQQCIGRQIQIKFKSSKFLDVGVYRMKTGLYKLKAHFKSYEFEIHLGVNQQQKEDKPHGLNINHTALVEELELKYQELRKANKNITQEMTCKYTSFIDEILHNQDEQMLKLQVYQNYPLLRLKNYLPIQFKDYSTKEPLTGPIFSNASRDCMFGHFTAYNAGSLTQLKGTVCPICMLSIFNLQENKLMQSLRDNIFNPLKASIFYCPEYNRFKISAKMSQKPFLNYMHFRANIKRLTTRHRNMHKVQGVQQFNLSFQINGDQHFIIDPARGRFCSHYNYTDLRLYYSSFDSCSYRCPICSLEMKDYDILYLKEVEILNKYALYKAKGDLKFAAQVKVIINHSLEKIFIEYSNSIKKVIEEVPQFYATMLNPYIQFDKSVLEMPIPDKHMLYDEFLYGAYAAETGGRTKKYEQINKVIPQDQNSESQEDSI